MSPIQQNSHVLDFDLLHGKVDVLLTQVGYLSELIVSAGFNPSSAWNCDWKCECRDRQHLGQGQLDAVLSGLMPDAQPFVPCSQQQLQEACFDGAQGQLQQFGV